MRFLKIFLVSFFSLIGALGAVLGIMYLAGSFNKQIIEPTEIHFEKQEFFVDADFSMTINSSTLGVTEKNVTLSLRGQDGEAVNGFITDGVIKIPQNITLGTPFSINLITAFNEEIGLKWIVGGQSQIFASSESDKAIDIDCKVHVDVPIHSLSLKTYTNDTQQTSLNSFALGENFYAEAVFSPASSKFKYSSSTIKKVYFDISFNSRGYIAENAEMIEAMQQAGKPNIYGYTVLKTTNTAVSSIGIKARAFQTAKIEDHYISLGLSEDDLVKYLQNGAYGSTANKNLTFTNRTVSDFEISNVNVTHTLATNKVSQVFANSKTSGVPSLGITISASDNTSLQGKISDVGLRLLVSEGGVYREATPQEISFQQNTKTDFAPNSRGEGLYFNNGTSFVEVSSVIAERYRKAGDIYTLSATGAYYKVGNDYILISENYGPTYDKYYFPTVVASNVDNSFWNIVAAAENLPFFFEVRLFEKDDVVQTANTTLHTYNTLTTFKTGAIVNTTISWANENLINLTFIDGKLDENKIYPEFNLSQNLQFSNINATYSFVKYYAYAQEGGDVSQILQNVSDSPKINLSQFNINQQLFEINGSIVRALGAGQVNVVAVIIKTDYQGHLVEKDGFYEVYAVSTPRGTSLNAYQPLEFNIDKTIQDLSATIDIYDESKIMNVPQDTAQTFFKLAFLQGQDVAPIFKLNLVITADKNTTILNETALFVNAWNSGKINLQAYTISGIASNLLHFNQDVVITAASGTTAGNTWVLPIDVYSLDVNIDTDLYIKVIYKQTQTITNQTFVNNCTLPDSIKAQAAFPETGYIAVEIYDGKASSAAFGIETTAETPVVKSLTLQQGTQLGTDFYVASQVGTTYMQGGTDVSASVLNQNGEYVVIFQDKYGNVINLPSSDYSITNKVPTADIDGNKILKVLNYSSVLEDNEQPTAELFLQESTRGELTEVKFNSGKVEDGNFASEFTDITTEYLKNENHNVQITRFGAKGANINLLGENGLLSILYQSQNLDAENQPQNSTLYQLYDIIDYKFDTTNWQTTYAGWLKLSDDGKTIEILTTIGTPIKLNIKANTGLGFVVQIELTILPNISTTYEVTTPQEGASDYVQNNTYYGIYSDNSVKITISLNMTLREKFSIGYKSNAQTNFFFGSSDPYYFVNDELSASAVLTVAFLAEELGVQTIIVHSGENQAYDFSREIYVYVNPNLQLVDATEKTLNKTISVAQLGVFYEALTAADYARIVGNKAITANSVSIEIARHLENDQSSQQVYIINPDGSKTITTNIFNCNGFNISAEQRLEGTYLVILNVFYGGTVIGQIYATISPNIQVDSESQSFASMFTGFNGKTHLTLVSNKTYNLSEIKALFKNVDFVAFNPTNLENVYTTSNVSNSSITVSSLGANKAGYYLQLSSSVGIINFPVLFTPLEIGSVRYNPENAVDKTATTAANNDISYLQNAENYLIKNKIYDVYDSGKTSSLISQNFTLTQSGNNKEIFTIKNLRAETVNLLAYTNGKYYTYSLAGINAANTSFKFALTLADATASGETDVGSINIVGTTGWTEVNVSAIGSEFLQTENNLIGVFKSATKFNSENQLLSDRGYGLSLALLLNNTYYSFLVVDETGDQIDFANMSNLSASQNATYDASKGLLTTKSSTENKIVWLLVKKADNIISAYRIFIIANSALNIYYPYFGAPINSNTTISGEEGEYVYFKGSQNAVINFNENISNAMPSSNLGTNIKRIMLQYGNQQIGFTNAENYNLIMQIQRMSINGVMTESLAAFNSYCTFEADTNRLTIKNTNDILVIYMYAEVKLAGEQTSQPGAGAVYKIFVNFRAINYELAIENAAGQLTDERLSNTKQTIAYGSAYDFSKVILVNNTGSSLNRTEGLKYYIYSKEGKNLNEYLNIDAQAKTLSVLPDVELVSDLEATMVFYTMFGGLCEVPLVFKSNINLQFNTNQTTVAFNQTTQTYSAYSDVQFNLTDVFTLFNGSTNMNIPAEYWFYQVNGGEYLPATNILFQQDLAAIYNISIKVALSQYSPETYLDDYVFAISLEIKESIISNFEAPNYMTVGVDGIMEYPTATSGNLTIADILLEESAVGGNDYLFSVQSAAILAEYQARINVVRGSEYVNNVNVSIAENKIILQLNSPAEQVEILVEVTLFKNEFSITSRFSFLLAPDAYVATQYPTANAQHELAYEAYYLNGTYINKHNDNSQAGSGSSASIKLTDLGFFNTARLKLTNGHGVAINPTAALVARTTVTVANQTNNIVVRVEKNGTHLNQAINFDVAANIDSQFFVQWVGGSEVVTNTTASLALNIYIDGILRTTYNITFYSQLSSIFSVSLAAHNDVTTFEGSDEEFEVFFVENASTGKLFANSDALLQFKLRQNYTTSLGSKTEIWNFYTDSVSPGNKIGSLNVKASDSAARLALSGKSQITIENLLVTIGENTNPYVFSTTAPNSIYLKYVDASMAAQLTYRAAASFLGEPLSYEKFSAFVLFDNQTAANFVLNKNVGTAINAPAYVSVNIKGTEFAKYRYSLLYDFAADPNFQADRYDITMKAGDELTAGLSQFAITRLNGTAFTQDYFANNAVTLDARIIMITDSQYPTSKSIDNIKYVDNQHIQYYNANLVNLGSEFYNYIDFASISYRQLVGSDRTYDFTIRADGAENNGNYVYVLVSFSANGVEGSMAHTVVKVFIQPVWNVQLYNDASFAEVNSQDNPLQIRYDSINSNLITSIYLAQKDSLANFINIYKGDNTSANFATQGNFALSIKDEIGGYLKLDTSYNQGSAYFKDYIILQNTTNTAKYGDKYGYIEIKDKYGYVCYYYLHLVAQSEDALSYASAIVGTSGSDVYEGSTIAIADSGYTANGSELTDYIFKINNLTNLQDLGLNYKITYTIANLAVESYNTNTGDANYNTGKISVQPASFYAGTTLKKQPVVLKIRLDVSGTINGNAYSESILLNAGINLVQRYTVTSGQVSYVREGQSFNVSDYISVRDETVNGNVGKIDLSSTAFSLKVPAALNGASIAVEALSGSGSTSTGLSAVITVGKMPNGQPKLASYGNYYYPLNEFSVFKNLAFANYTFVVKSVTLPNDIGFVLSPLTSYTLGGGESQSATDYIFYNSYSAQSVSLVFYANGNYYYKTYGHSSKTNSINTSTIVNGWNIDATNSFPSQSNAGFVGIYNADRTSLISAINAANVYGSAQINLVKDKLLSVVTLDVGATTINVSLNNQTYKVDLPFILNTDGTQSTSVYEAILKLCSGNTADVRLNNIALYEKDKNVVTADDMQKLKGITIYNNTLAIKVAGGYSGKDIDVRVHFTDENGQASIKTKTFRITNNNPHLYYVSLYNILGEKYGLKVDVSYKIEVVYTLTNIASGAEDSFKNVIEPSAVESTVTFAYDAINSNCTYTHTISAFNVSQMPIVDNVYSDKIDMLAAAEFTNKVKANVQKFYLVKYTKDNVVYYVDVNYNVTPKYYQIDASGVLQDGNNYNIIYFNQCTPINENEYQIPFENWAGNYILDDYYGTDITLLTEAKNDLYFEIQTTDENQQTTSTGAAFLTENKSLQTTSSFNPEQHYIKVSVYTFINGQQNQKVYIGDIFIKLDLTSVSVPVPGTYNIKINSPTLGGLCYTINTPYEFTSRVAKIDNILKNNPNMADLVRENPITAQLQLGFYTGNYYTYKAPAECTFSVVSVFSGIYESRFESGTLNIKINLNETQGSIGQRITLQALALPTSSVNTSKTSQEFYLTVGYALGVYYLNYSTSSGGADNTKAQIFKGEDGFFSVQIQLGDIFSETFVGTDYNYKISINGIESVDVSSSLSVIYVENTEMAIIDQTMFFQISYIATDSSMQSKVIAIKNTTENQKLAGPLGYAIDVRNLLGGVNLQNCTVAFLGSYNLECENGGNYQLLLSYKIAPDTTVYSIAVIDNYSTNEPFFVEDYALSMLNFSIGFDAKVDFYNYSTQIFMVGTGATATTILMPTFLDIDNNSSIDTDLYYCFQTVQSEVSLFALKTSGGKAVVQCIMPPENISQKDIRIKNCNAYFSENVSDNFGAETEISEQWQAKINQSILHTKTNITKITHTGSGQNIQQFSFDVAPILWAGSLGSAKIINSNLSLETLVSSLDASQTYYFQTTGKNAENKDVFYGSLAIKGNNIAAVDVGAIRQQVGALDQPKILFALQKITGNIEVAGLYNFEISNISNVVERVTAANYQQVSGTNYLVSATNFLANSGKANLLNNSIYNYYMIANGKITYYTITNASGEQNYYASYLSSASNTIPINIGSLAEGESINILSTNLSLLAQDSSKPLNFVVSARSYDQIFNFSAGSTTKQITIPANSTEIQIDLTNLFGNFSMLTLYISAYNA